MIRSFIRFNPRLYAFEHLSSPGQYAAAATRFAAWRNVNNRRSFHQSASAFAVKPFLLADIGEGIRECEVIQWFVEPEARVEQFDKICEVQSDKASVEITSRFDGVIKKLHYEAGDTAIVGKPLVDIDIQSEISAEDEAYTTAPPAKSGEESAPQQQNHNNSSLFTAAPPPPPLPESSRHRDRNIDTARSAESTSPKSKLHERTEPTRSSSPAQFSSAQSHNHGQGTPGTLATPAVRRVAKEFQVNIEDVPGSGRDGRVLKEDVERFVASLGDHPTGGAVPLTSEQTSLESGALTPSSTQVHKAEDRIIPLTPIQSQMFKQMTRSLSIPHFLYSDETDLTALLALRSRSHPVLSSSSSTSSPSSSTSAASSPSASNNMSVSFLPYIIKAVSLALTEYPLLNARLDFSSSPSPSSSFSSSSSGSPPPPSHSKPSLLYRASHNIGIAMDTPSGLLVPVIKNVSALRIIDISSELARLQALARTGKLSTADLSSGTFTISNIGSIGGGSVVAPVILSDQLAILGVGRARPTPVFVDAEDRGGGGNGQAEKDQWVRRDMAMFSYSADHRVVDGASMARFAAVVKRLVERPEDMLRLLR